MCITELTVLGMLATKAFYHQATSPNPIYMKGWEQADGRIGIKIRSPCCYPYCPNFTESFGHWLFLWGETLKQFFLISSWGVGGNSASISQEITWSGESRNKILGLRSPCEALWREALYFSLTGLSVSPFHQSDQKLEFWSWGEPLRKTLLRENTEIHLVWQNQCHGQDWQQSS